LALAALCVSSAHVFADGEAQQAPAAPQHAEAVAAPLPATDSDRYVPQQTTVAILPVIDASGERWKKQSSLIKEGCSQKAIEEFTSHGFNVVPADAVAKAIGDLNVDLTDEEQQKRDTLYKVGKALKADLIMFVVIAETQQKEVDRFLWTSRHGSAKVKVWLLNRATGGVQVGTPTSKL
jgi:hypothetical protein